MDGHIILHCSISLAHANQLLQKWQCSWTGVYSREEALGLMRYSMLHDAYLSQNLRKDYADLAAPAIDIAMPMFSRVQTPGSYYKAKLLLLHISVWRHSDFKTFTVLLAIFAAHVRQKRRNYISVLNAPGKWLISDLHATWHAYLSSSYSRSASEMTYGALNSTQSNRIAGLFYGIAL